MALRCVYTDLDGTLLGPRGSLFRDPEGNFTLRQARALEACHRAGVEVVIMSGRREAQVLSDARLLGQTSYIYEAGCGVMIDGERTLLTGDWTSDEDGDNAGRADARRRDPRAAVRALRGPAGVARALAHRPRALAADARQGRRRRGERSCSREHGHDDLRFLDNGAIGRPMEGIEGRAHAYHLVPGGASKAKGVAFHLRARGYDPESCIGVGDSIEDLEAAAAVGRFFCVANGPERDEALREALPRFPNATVTEGAMGDGFYEAVVSTLASAERRLAGDRRRVGAAAARRGCGAAGGR